MAPQTKFLNQSYVNFSFVKSNIVAFPSDYFDWKIIATFYCSMHLMKAFLVQNYKIYPNSHPEIESEINFDKGQTKIKEHVWKAYRNLRVESEKCRYSGHNDLTQWNLIKKKELNNCLERLKIINSELIKKNIKSQFSNEELDTLIKGSN
ncbi:hypothetical protein C9994_02440 [Marivirga lumbricoides]|uniref:HEPN domain-containing protein n=1 Tax=Marivirga lumbricoides TaxID=1046115 RepID=A0A2T4DUQ8_9BACT|nr:hypothetical protein C9994_02440 [Marivirga lumbricoides]